MKRISQLISIVLIAHLILISSPSLAQNYALPWWTLDGGGGTSTGGSYAISGTIGQPEAGVMAGGSYTLMGGFWVQDLSTMIFLPLILKN